MRPSAALDEPDVFFAEAKPVLVLKLVVVRFHLSDGRPLRIARRLIHALRQLPIGVDLDLVTDGGSEHSRAAERIVPERHANSAVRVPHGDALAALHVTMRREVDAVPHPAHVETRSIPTQPDSAALSTQETIPTDPRQVFMPVSFLKVWIRLGRLVTALLVAPRRRKAALRPLVARREQRHGPRHRTVPERNRHQPHQRIQDERQPAGNADFAGRRRLGQLGCPHSYIIISRDRLFALPDEVVRILCIQDRCQMSLRRRGLW